MTEQKIWIGVRRGLVRHCPECGRGRLFDGFLDVRRQCNVCGADNSIYPSDDMPPYVTVLLVGHLIVPLLFVVDRAYAPALWLQFIIWPVLTGLLCLLLLPRIKGGVVGLCWATGTTRQGLAG